MADEILVEGLRDLNRALAKADRDLRLGVRRELRSVAEPVRYTAEQLASTRIARIGPPRTQSWARMRTGITQKLVYVAPRQRGKQSRSNPKLRRPKFAPLLLERAMEPAVALNEPLVEARFEHMLDTIADDF